MRGRRFADWDHKTAPPEIVIEHLAIGCSTHLYPAGFWAVDYHGVRSKLSGWDGLVAAVLAAEVEDGAATSLRCLVVAVSPL
jgi:hypothetical protein